MSTAGYNSENSEVNVRYARGRRGTSLSCLTGCDHSFFLFGFLSSHDIAQGIQRGKGWWGARWDTQGKATAAIPDNAARGSLLTWTEVDDLIRTSRHTAIPFPLWGFLPSSSSLTLQDMASGIQIKNGWPSRHGLR